MTRDTLRPCRPHSQLNVHSKSKLAGESTYHLPALQPASLASSALSEGDSQNPCSQTCWQFLWILKIFFFVKILECGDSGSEKPSDLTWTHLCSRTSGRRWANEADSTCYLATPEYWGEQSSVDCFTKQNLAMVGCLFGFDHNISHGIIASQEFWVDVVMTSYNWLNLNIAE